MIGSLNLPIAKGNAKTYVFTVENTSVGGGGVPPWRGMTVWNKPQGINFVYGILISPGTGGGGGFSFGAGTAGGGGGGGSAGPVMQFIQPAYVVPDTLAVTVGRGGLGGAASTAGSNPSLATGIWYTKVGENSTNTARFYYAYPASTQTGVNSGRTGTALAGGNGGTAASVSATNSQPGITGFSNFSQTPGSTGAGQNGGFAAGGNNAPFVGRPQGGAGGGGVSSSISYTGGNVLGPTTSNLSIWSRNLLGGTSAGANGEDGITLFEPTFLSLPGAGGAGNASGTGGNGGKGGIGCGGGGGGAGTTGGRGGDGGDGLVILVCW
jgi:hypothetical protein